MIAMQPSRSNLPSSHEHWRASATFPEEGPAGGGGDSYPHSHVQGRRDAPELAAHGRRPSLSASFLPPAASPSLSMSSSASHHLSRGLASNHLTVNQYLGGATGLDEGQHQQHEQLQQREQLLDLYEQQRRLDAQRLQLLRERQQAYLDAASSYEEASVAQGHHHHQHHHRHQLSAGQPAMTLRDSLLPSFLQQQHQHQQQYRAMAPDDFPLSRQTMQGYPPQVQAPSQLHHHHQQQQHPYAVHRALDEQLPASTAADDHRTLSLLQRLPASQWNLPSSMLPSVRTWEDDAMEKQGAPLQQYGRFASSRGYADFGLVNNAPASEDDEGDSGKIEAARGPTSSILPVPSQIDYSAHKPGPDLESALAASLTGDGAGNTTRSNNDKSSAAASFPSERAHLEALTTRCETPAQATRVLRILGSTLRSKADPFVDVTTLPFVATAAADGMSRFGIGSASLSRTRKTAASASASAASNTSFPETLHDLLEMADREQLDDIVSWLPHKRAFRINNKDRFMQEILPLYFKGQNRWSSFLRQLNLYGFSRVAKGTDYGAYYHELMIGGRPDLCQFMRRVGTPKGLDRRTFKLAEGDDPDFYAMPLVLGSLHQHLAMHPHGRIASAPSVQRRSAG